MGYSNFLKIVKECRKNESPRMIYNASYDHAYELFVNLFEEAKERKEDVLIVSGDLKNDFYGQLTNIAKEVMEKGVKVQVAVLNPSVDLNSNEFARVVLAGGGTVYQAKKQEVKASHFMTVGDRRFRVEIDHSQAKAVASFNGPEICSILKDTFNKIVTSENVEKFLPNM